VRWSWCSAVWTLLGCAVRGRAAALRETADGIPGTYRICATVLLLSSYICTLPAGGVECRIRADDLLFLCVCTWSADLGADLRHCVPVIAFRHFGTRSGDRNVLEEKISFWRAVEVVAWWESETLL